MANGYMLVYTFLVLLMRHHTLAMCIGCHRYIQIHNNQHSDAQIFHHEVTFSKIQPRNLDILKKYRCQKEIKA